MFEITTTLSHGQHFVRVDSIDLLNDNGKPLFSMELFELFDESPITVKIDMTKAYRIVLTNNLLSTMLDAIWFADDIECPRMKFRTYAEYAVRVKQIEVFLKEIGAIFLIEYANSRYEPLRITDASTAEMIMAAQQ